MLIISCGGSSDNLAGGDAGDENPRDNFATGTGGGTPIIEEGSNSNLNDEEIKALVHEVLGQMILSKVGGESAPFSGPINNKSETVGFEATVSHIEEHLDIEADNGNATVDAEGTLDILKSDNAADPVYYFSPIDIKINLDSFTVNISEIGVIDITGNISCNFKGRYETHKLIGRGKLKTGAFDEEGELSFVYNGEFHNIKYNVVFNVYGNPFDLSSYKFSGEFFLDGAPINLDNVL